MSVELQVALENAAREIASRSNDEWAGLIGQLLGKLKKYASRDDHRRFLRELFPVGGVFGVLSEEEVASAHEEHESRLKMHFSFETGGCSMGVEEQSQVGGALCALEKVVTGVMDSLEELLIVLSPVLRPVEEIPCTVEETPELVPLAARIYEIVWQFKNVQNVILGCRNRLEL